MDHEIEHDTRAHSFRLRDDGEVLSLADYRLAESAHGPVMEFHHTFTRPEHRGNGYAARVVRAGLDDARARSAKVVATCWFVADFLRDHPEYRDLVA